MDTLRQIVKTIKDSGHELARDWIEEAYQSNKTTGHIATDWAEIYKSNLETIAKSDVVIADATYENFGVGYQIAVAVQQKKPILLMRQDVLSSKKGAFALGVLDEWVSHALYTPATATAIVKRFLDENDIGIKDMRFNFFIDRQIYNYLRWTALKTGKTKAEILRGLVEKEIENQS